MIGAERDLIICDLAETYQIYDYHRVPVKTLDTLISGLGPDTRIGMKRSGRKAPINTVLLANIYDALFTEKGKPTKTSLFLVETKHDRSDNKTKFESADDYEAARENILRKIRNGHTGNSICTDSTISTGDQR